MKRSIGILLAACVLAACQGSEATGPETVEVKNLPEKILLPVAPEDPVQFEILSNRPWSISQSGLDWLTISPMKRLGGPDPVVVTIQAGENTSFGARSGSFTIQAGENFSRTVTVEQAGTETPAFLRFPDLDENLVYFQADDTPRTVNVEANVDWTATAEGLDWCTVTPMEGSANRLTTLTLTPSLNEGAVREGTLSLDYGDGTPLVLTVTQAGFDPILTLTPTEIAVSYLAQTENLVLTANGTWTATCDAAWLSLSEKSGTGDAILRLSIEENGTTARETAITFDNHGKTVVVNVRQNAKITQYLTADPAAVALGGAGKAVSVAVSSNTGWKAASSDTWLTVSPASGSGNGTLSISATPNGLSEPRTGTILLTSADESLLLKFEISVTQEIMGDLDAFIDLKENKVEWICNNQALAMETSPDYAHSGQNGAVSGKGTGIFYPSSFADLAYAQFVHDSGNGKTYTTTFIIAKEGNIAFKQIWTGDAIEFHVPVVKIAQGQILHFDFGLRGTAACPAYYRAEATFDGGKTWVAFDTGETFTPADGISANAFLTTADRAVPYNATLEAPATLELSELVVRIVVAYGNIRVNKSTSEEPAANGTLRLMNTTKAATLFDGPTLYVTEAQ